MVSGGSLDGPGVGWTSLEAADTKELLEPSSRPIGKRWHIGIQPLVVFGSSRAFGKSEYWQGSITTFGDFISAFLVKEKYHFLSLSRLCLYCEIIFTSLFKPILFHMYVPNAAKEKH